MRIIVDTNVIFSALLHSNRTIGDLLFNSPMQFEFYSFNYMRHEIRLHWEKLKKISGLPDKQLQISYTQVLSKLNFINEDLIPMETWMQAHELTKEIDLDDTAFIALTIFLQATLWTGDKVLYNGLIDLNFKNIVTTSEILKVRSSIVER